MRTHTAHSKALKAAHAAELALLEVQRKLQVAQAAERAAADALESAREHAERTTGRVQEKNREVEMLRAQKVGGVSHLRGRRRLMCAYRRRTRANARARLRRSLARLSGDQAATAVCATTISIFEYRTNTQLPLHVSPV
jgi:hypothetical protein